MNEKFPPVSIFIATYLTSNERGAILKDICVNALAQNYPDFEVVVSDNAGEYFAEEALAAISDPRLKIFRNKSNIGQSGNTNMCLEYCTHDIIKLNCDDDLLHPDFLKLTVPYVNDETLVVVDHVEYTIGDVPEALSQALSKPKVIKRTPGYRKGFWEFPYISLPGCTLFTKKLFEELGGYQASSVLPDWDFMMEARLNKTVAHVHATLCYMGVWEESLTQQMLAERPYFFSQSSLITRFRILRDPDLAPVNRHDVRITLTQQFVTESLRLLKNMHRGSYWKGYSDYLRTFFLFMARGEKNRNNGEAC